MKEIAVLVFGIIVFIGLFVWAAKSWPTNYEVNELCKDNGLEIEAINNGFPRCKLTN